MPLHSLDFTIVFVFYDYALAMNYDDSIRYLNSRMCDKTSVIIIFHLLDASSTRCDPLSVGIENKNGGEQSGADISLFRVFISSTGSGRL